MLSEMTKWLTTSPHRNSVEYAEEQLSKSTKVKECGTANRTGIQRYYMPESYAVVLKIFARDNVQMVKKVIF